MNARSTMKANSKSPKPRKRLQANPEVGITNFHLAVWFCQENCELLPPGFSDLLIGHIRARNMAGLREMQSRYDVPQLYARPSDYHVVAQALALVSKAPTVYGGGAIAQKDKAVSKFLFTELLCRISTRRLDHYWKYPEREDPTMRLILTRARSLVDSVLGDVYGALPQIIAKSRFGPGMTLCSPDPKRTTPYYKLYQESDLTVSPTASWYASQVIQQSPQWALNVSEINWDTMTARVRWKESTSCRLTFVPKDETTFRTIAIEPYGNVMVQLGVHSYLAQRLKTHAGIDIHSQRWNQEAARWGSENEDFVDTVSTIDLSSASDCVSPGLIRRLVRPSWVALLDDIRSKVYDLDGSLAEFSKWSSMGNGYTFSLETLLFWALAQACETICGSSNKALAYGDDIIVSKGASLLVLQVLRYCGFRVNHSKTHVVGPFRESCGRDFHTGVPVRPTFVRKHKLMVSDCFSFLNQLDVGAKFSTDELFETVLKAIPPERRYWGPSSECVDSHIHAPWWWLHENKPVGFKWNADGQYHVHRSLDFIPKIYRGFDPIRYITWLYTFRDRTSVIDKKSWAQVSDLRVEVTQRSRGNFRVRSARAVVRPFSVRNFFLTKG